MTKLLALLIVAISITACKPYPAQQNYQKSYSQPYYSAWDEVCSYDLYNVRYRYKRRRGRVLRFDCGYNEYKRWNSRTESWMCCRRVR